VIPNHNRTIASNHQQLKSPHSPHRVKERSKKATENKTTKKSRRPLRLGLGTT
jgi:hypothetical protein